MNTPVRVRTRVPATCSSSSSTQSEASRPNDPHARLELAIDYLPAFNGELREEKKYYYVVDVVYPKADHNVDRSNDWALLETRERSQTGWLELVDPINLPTLNNLRLAIAGYSSDLNGGSQITMDWGCRGELADGSWAYLCHTWKGASGSPIVVVNADGFRAAVVGVHAAGTTDMVAKGSATGVRLGAANPSLFKAYAAMRSRLDAADRAAGKSGP